MGLKSIIGAITSAVSAQQSLKLMTALFQFGVMSGNLVVALVGDAMNTEIVIHLLQFIVDETEGIVKRVVGGSLMDRDNYLLPDLWGAPLMNQR